MNYMGKCLITLTPVTNVIKLLWHNLCHYWHNLIESLKYMPIKLKKSFTTSTRVAKVKKLFSYLNHNKNKLSQIEKTPIVAQIIW